MSYAWNLPIISQGSINQLKCQGLQGKKAASGSQKNSQGRMKIFSPSTGCVLVRNCGLLNGLYIHSKPQFSQQQRKNRWTCLEGSCENYCKVYAMHPKECLLWVPKVHPVSTLTLLTVPQCKEEPGKNARLLLQLLCPEKSSQSKRPWRQGSRQDSLTASSTLRVCE